MVDWTLAFFTTLVAAALGYALHWYGTKGARAREQALADDVVARARSEADVIRREIKAEAQEEIIEERRKLEEETKALRGRVRDLEDGVRQRSGRLDQREQELDREQKHTARERERLVVREQELEQMMDEGRAVLEGKAGLSRDEARERLAASMRKDVELEMARYSHKLQREIERDTKSKARTMLAQAMERYAGETVIEVTTTSVPLPSDELKGRIIGKEGRNIRSLEAETGVNILVDETPGAVVLSCFDPMRREVARRALELLIKDGRIHPTSIEETVYAVRAEVEEHAHEAAEDAMFKLRIGHVAPEVVEVLGRLQFRQSYSQNVLSHSVETAELMALLAVELDLEEDTAKRIGLFHDIGKAMSHEASGPHALVGAKLLQDHGEDPVVVNAVASHHREADQNSPYAHLIAAADAITAARPGSRQENTSQFFKRLEDLEAMAVKHDGVISCFAIQAGRELRVLVNPREISDEQAEQLARELCAQIQDTQHVQGQIKVTVIRETRSVHIAR